MHAIAIEMRGLIVDVDFRMSIISVNGYNVSKEKIGATLITYGDQIQFKITIEPDEYSSNFYQGIHRVRIVDTLDPAFNYLDQSVVLVDQNQTDLSSSLNVSRDGTLIIFSFTLMGNQRAYLSYNVSASDRSSSSCLVQLCNNASIDITFSTVSGSDSLTSSFHQSACLNINYKPYLANFITGPTYFSSFVDYNVVVCNIGLGIAQSPLLNIIPSDDLMQCSISSKSIILKNLSHNECQSTTFSFNCSSIESKCEKKLTFNSTTNETCSKISTANHTITFINYPIVTINST